MPASYPCGPSNRCLSVSVMGESAVLVHREGLSPLPARTTSEFVRKLAVGDWKGKGQGSRPEASYFNDKSHSESSRQEMR